MSVEKMRDKQMTNAELLKEAETLRKRVAELKQTQEALRESENKWRSLLRDTPDIVMIVDRDGTIRFINHTVPGIKEQEATGKRVYDYISPEHHDTMRKDLERVFQTGQGASQEISGVGNSSWYQAQLGPIKQDGRIVAASIVTRDITERKKVDENLRESEARYRALFQGTAEGIIVADIETMKYKYVNPAICNMLGYTEEELMRLSVPDIHRREDLEYALSDFKAQARGERVLSSNMPCLRKDGTILYADIHTTKILIDGTQCNVGFFTDVTERKEAEDEIHKFKEMADRATYGCVISDLKGNLTYINDSFADMHGYTSAELIGKNLRIFHTDAQMKRVRQLNKKLVNTDEGVKGEEVWHVRRDGREFPTLMNNWLLKDSNGNPYLMCATAIDITEHKNTEQSLRVSENKYRKLFNNIADPIFVADLETGILIDCNRSASELVGREKSELIGKHQRILHPPKETEGEFSRTFEKHSKEKRGQVLETQVITKKGEIKEVAIRADLTELEGKKRILLGMFRDITERKNTEQSLRESEERLRVALSAAQMGTWRWEPSTNQDARDASLNGILGLEAVESTQPIDDFLQRVHPEDRDMVDGELQRALREHCTYVAEFRIIRPDGTVRWLRDQGKPLYDENDHILYLTGAVVDITEQKRAEEVIRESEKRYRALFQGAAEGIVVADVETMKYKYVNPAICKMLGYTEEELKLLGVRDVHPKEDLDYVISEFKIQTKGERMLSQSIPCLRKDGTIIYADINSTNLVIDGRQCNVGFFTDVTDRKEAVETLRESEERYRILVENQTDMVVKFDKDSTLLFASPSYCKTFGKSQDELIGNKFMPLIHREDRKKVAEMLNNVYKPPYSAYVEERALTKDGWRRQAWLNTAILNNQKKVEAVIGVGRDITEQKLAEEKLQESENKHRTLLENLPQKIFLKDKKSVYLSCNENLARDLKIKPEEITGKRDSDFFPRKLAQEYRLIDKQIVESGDTREFDEKYIEDGQERIVHTVKTPVKDAQGNVIGILGIFWDVTEIKRAEKELNEYREKMAHAEQLASLGTLSATLAHELNQPLTAIRLSIENSLADLETISCPGSVIEDLSDSLSAVSDVTSKVNILRDFARKSSDEIISEVNLKEVAERILKLLHESARRARISLHLKGIDKLPLIQSNEKDLEQLFFALVENAIQAADGKKECQFIISGDVKDEHIELRFSDTCGGIAPENLGKIFEPFFTAGPEGTRTGLGLCIVERIVSGDGGKIRVESKAGKGTTFYITLPINEGRLS